LSDGWLFTDPVSSRSRISNQVTHGEARPLRPISRTEAPCRGTLCKERSLPVELLAPVPTPRADHMGAAGGASLGRVRPLASVVILTGTALFGSDCQTAASCAVHRLAPIPASPTCENRAPTPRSGLGRMEHERDAFRRVVRRALTRSPDSRGSGCDTTVSRTAHPFVTPPLLLDRPHGQPKPDILWIPVRERVARRVRAIVTRFAGGPV
jgi:hypothetical protein